MSKIFILILILFISANACRKSPVEYETNTGINRVETIKNDKNGNPLILDVELTYPDCPGEQIEIIRGNKDFAGCMQNKYKKGDVINTKILWSWNSLGFYNWKITQVGECPRKLDEDDEFSYDMIEECEEYIVYDVNVGFRCKRVATKELIEKCPWFRRK